MSQLKSISAKDNISLDLVCYLCSMEPGQDNSGNDVGKVIDRLVFCNESLIYSSEFYNAGQMGIKPEKLIVIDSEEYNDESVVKFNEIKYNIYRVYPRSDGFTELFCNKKAGVI